MKPSTTAIVGALLLTGAAAACDRQATRERRRAERLDSTLVRLAADTSPRRLPDWPEARTGRVRRLVPEWEELRAALVSCGTALSEVSRALVARDLAGAAERALAGWRTSGALEARAFARMSEVLKHTEALQDVYAEGDSLDAFTVYNSVSRSAIAYNHDFLRTLHLLAELGPPSLRGIAFERLAGEIGPSDTSGLAAAAGDVLRDVWAKEDDGGLKTRMAERLRALKLPLAPPAAPVASGPDSVPAVAAPARR